jgi:hypothetical protein
VAALAAAERILAEEKARTEVTTRRWSAQRALPEGFRGIGDLLTFLLTRRV